MPDRDKPHLIIRAPAQATAYQPPQRNMPSSPQPAPDDRRQHGQQLQNDLHTARSDATRRREERPVTVDGAVEGIYVTFDSFPDVRLALETLDPRQGKAHPELMSVTEVDLGGGATAERATVFIPDGKISYFLDRMTQYVKAAATDAPRHRALLDNIQSIRAASITALWTDPLQELPGAGELVWWEVWLRRRNGREVERLRAFAAATGVRVGRQSLGFGDRTVVLLQATMEQLASAVDVLDDLAELRRPHDPIQFLARLSAADQAEWVDDLASRLQPADPAAPAVCIVDSG